MEKVLSCVIIFSGCIYSITHETVDPILAGMEDLQTVTISANLAPGREELIYLNKQCGVQLSIKEWQENRVVILADIVSIEKLKKEDKKAERLSILLQIEFLLDYQKDKTSNQFEILQLTAYGKAPTKDTVVRGQYHQTAQQQYFQYGEGVTGTFMVNLTNLLLAHFDIFEWEYQLVLEDDSHITFLLIPTDNLPLEYVRSTLKEETDDITRKE